MWTRHDFILADLVDAVNTNTWVVANKDVETRNRSSLPEPYERPGDEAKPKRKQITAADLKAFKERTSRG